MNRNKKIILEFLLCIFCAVASIYIIYNLAEHSRHDSTWLWESVLHDFDTSPALQKGVIYTIDGEPMSKNYQAGGSRYYTASQRAYSNIVGFGEKGGLSYGMRRILQGSSSASNFRTLTGDSVITTYHSRAQRKAAELLSQMDNGADACIVVVGADGAVLVDAGSNSFDPARYVKWEAQSRQYENEAKKADSEEAAASARSKAEELRRKQEIRDMWLDYGTAANAVGSSFKPILGRVLVRHNDRLPEEYSVYNQRFDDVSLIVTSRGDEIRNHDSRNAAAYRTNEDGVYHRSSTFAQAFENSSNTFFIRHAQQLGLKDTYQYFQNEFFLESDIRSDTIRLEGCRGEENRYEYLMFGQDAVLSPIRLASMYNLAFSGEAYVPFTVVRIIEPDGNVLYQCRPKKLEKYTQSDIDLTEDILFSSLNENFLHYLSKDMKKQYSGFSARIAGKSGTAELTQGKRNRTFAVTLLDKSDQKVICSAVIAVNRLDGNVSNQTLISCLVQTINELDVL